MILRNSFRTSSRTSILKKIRPLALRVESDADRMVCGTSLIARRSEEKIMTYELTEMKAKCTSCRAVFVVTDAQMAEARDIGCLFCACGSVATVERVTARQKKQRGRKS